MMGILDTLFPHVEDQPNPVPAVQSAPKVSIAIPPAPTPRINDAMVVDIRKHVMEKPSAFTRFMTHAKALEAVITDEPTRIKAALATSGVGKGEIRAGLDQHVRALQDEAKEFDGTIDGDRKANIDPLEKGVSEQEKQIEQIHQTISQLSEDLTTAEGRRDEIKTQIAERTAELDALQRDFERAAKFVLDELMAYAALLA